MSVEELECHMSLADLGPPSLADLPDETSVESVMYTVFGDGYPRRYEDWCTKLASVNIRTLGDLRQWQIPEMKVHTDIPNNTPVLQALFSLLQSPLFQEGHFLPPEDQVLANKMIAGRMAVDCAARGVHFMAHMRVRCKHALVFNCSGQFTKALVELQWLCPCTCSFQP